MSYAKNLSNDTTRSPIIRVIGVALQYPFYLLASIVCSALVAVFGVGTLASFIPFLDTLLEPEGALENLAEVKYVLNYWNPAWGTAFEEFATVHLLQADIAGKTQALIYFSLLIVFITILKGCAKFVVTYSTTMVTNRAVIDMQDRLFAHMMDMDYAFFQKTGVAQIISRCTNDIEHIYKGVKTFSGKLFLEPFQIVVYTLACLVFNWQLTVYYFILFPFLGLCFWWIGKYSRRKGKKMLVSKGQLVRIMQEAYHSIRIVKVFNAQQKEIDTFGRENKNVLRNNMKVAVAEGFMVPFTEVIGIAGASIIVVIGSGEVLAGNMTAGAFIAYLIALTMMINSVRKLGNVNSRIQHCAAGAERVFEFIDAPIYIKSAESAKTVDRLTEKLSLHDLTFCYDDGTEVLSSLNLELNIGETLAVVGPSGAGKSTLVNLIPRFYDPASGSIKIDGVDIQEYSLVSLRRLIGMVTQETLLFDDTIRNNIAYGDDVDEARLIAAAKSANAHEFIEASKDGYETVIGEHGTTLSGGQCQRLCIARAIYKDPQILILDEATSSLDTENERVIQKVLDEFMQDRTSVVIAHRLSTIQNADRILVLNQGRMEAIGTHASLMETCPTYQNLYKQHEALD